MGQEIERKFTVRGESWKHNAESKLYKQGYIDTSPESTVRVRLIEDQAFLTIKGRAVRGVRSEFEYEIPAPDANEILATLCKKPVIDKRRYVVQHNGMKWEIDEFHQDNAGLILAEVELSSIDQEIVLPEWIDVEVTNDPRYYNSNLVKFPYSKWSKRD